MRQKELARKDKRSRTALLVLRYYDLLICTAVSAAYAIVILRYQARWPDIATRWDSLHYVEVAHDIRRGEQPSAAAPFVFRLGLPALSAFIFPSDVVRGMSRIAFVSAVMTPTLMLIWLKMFPLRRIVRVALVAVFASSLFGPVRFGLFYPTLTYPIFWVFLLTGLILTRRVLLGGGGVQRVLLDRCDCIGDVRKRNHGHCSSNAPYHRWNDPTVDKQKPPSLCGRTGSTCGDTGHFSDTRFSYAN